VCSHPGLLLLQPEQLSRLRSDWSLTPNAIEEVLRFEPLPSSRADSRASPSRWQAR
jgi:cytochrome P450